MAQVASDLLAAGREAMVENDWTRAYDLLRQAADAGHLDAEAFEDLARSAWWSGRPDECIDAREQAFAGHMRDGHPASAALTALDLAEGLFHKKATALGLNWVKRAGRLLADEDESAAHGWLARMQAVIAFEGDEDLDRGLELAGQAYEVGTRYGDANLQALALHDQGRITVAAGDVEAGMDLMDEAMVAAIGGDLGAFYTGKIYCNMIDICEQLADYRRAGDWSDAARRWCERAGHSSGFPGVCRIHRAEIMRLRGDWKTAEEEATKASRELGNFVDFGGEAFYEIGEIRLHMGDDKLAEEAFQRAHGMGRDPEPGMAELQLSRGNPDRAWTLISQSLDSAGAPLKRARLLPATIEIALARGDRQTAGEAVSELKTISESYGSPALVAHADQGQGALLLADGNSKQAVEPLRRAAESWRANDFPYLAARARLLLAAAYEQHGSSDSANLELKAALAIFEELGAMADARKVRLALADSAHPAGSGTRTSTALMFTDIVDSTPLIGVIGDESWEQLLRWHHRTLRSLFAGAGGQEVENTGDGFFISFDQATAAVACAVEIQQTLARQRADQGFAPDVRIGMHAGEVTEIDGTLAGEGVHKTARICSEAGAGEIVASLDLVSQTELDAGALAARPVDLKGFVDPVMIATIPWA